MIKFNIVVALLLCTTLVYPAACMTRWFSASYYDLHVTLRRYGYCVGELPPLRDERFSDPASFLVNQIKVFLNQSDYSSDQMANVTNLMHNICRNDTDAQYPISVNIDVKRYQNSNPQGKEYRCRAIDEAMSAMYNVFKRAALNASEPLDFSVIQFYPNATNRAVSYNLTDLINTSWISSDTILEHVCNMTAAVRDYVGVRVSKSTIERREDMVKREEQGRLAALMRMIDRILEPLLGYQRRLYWDGNNMFESGYQRLGNSAGYVRDSVASGFKNVQKRIQNVFASSNSTVVVRGHNVTLSNRTSYSVGQSTSTTSATTTTTVAPTQS